MWARCSGRPRQHNEKERQQFLSALPKPRGQGSRLQPINGFEMRPPIAEKQEIVLVSEGDPSGIQYVGHVVRRR